MIDIIKTGTVSYICYKSLVCFGKKEYGDMVAFISVLYIGAMFCMKIGGWYNAFMGSAFMQLMYKIFG